MSEDFNTLVDRLMSIHGYDRDHAEIVALSWLQTSSIMAKKRGCQCGGNCQDCDPADCTDCECA